MTVWTARKPEKKSFPSYARELYDCITGNNETNIARRRLVFPNFGVTECRDTVGWTNSCLNFSGFAQSRGSINNFLFRPLIACDNKEHADGADRRKLEFCQKNHICSPCQLVSITLNFRLFTCLTQKNYLFPKNFQRINRIGSHSSNT